MTETDHVHGYAQDRFVHEGGAFKAQPQAAKTFEPGEGAFDDVAIRAQPAAMSFATLGQKGDDAALPEPFAVSRG